MGGLGFLVDECEPIDCLISFSAVPFLKDLLLITFVGIGLVLGRITLNRLGL